MLFVFACVLLTSANAATTYNIGSTSMAVATGDGVCTLTEALLSVQTNTTVNECVASGGPYTINIAPGTYVFDTSRYLDGNFGRAAFATVAADVSLIGSGPGVTLQRSGSGENMRFLYGGPFRATTVTNLTITGFNSSDTTEIAARFGGAIGVVQHTLNLDRVTITGNSAGFAAGEGDASAIMAFASQVNIHASTIADNTALNTFNSSQIRANQNSTLNMANSTVVGIHIAVNTTLNSVSNLSNVTLSGQLALFDDGAGSTTSIRNSILITGCQMAGAFSSTNNAGPGNCGSSFTLPVLSALKDNGGPTRTFMPRLPSSVKDAAPGCTYLSAGTNPLFANGAAITTDQRGFARDANCDVGPVEMLTISPASLPGGTVGVPFSATLSQAGGGAPVTFAVTSGSLLAGLSLNAATGEISGTPSAAGTSVPTITVTDSGGFTSNIQYILTVARGNQTLTFNTQTTTTRSFVAGSTFPISPLATASSMLTPTYTSDSPGVCTVSGTTVTMVSGGLCVIRAQQSGNSNYNSATAVTQTVTINPGPQTLTFNAQLAASQTFVAGGTFAINPVATTNAGAPVVEHSSLTPAVCTVTGTTVTMVAAGTCTLRASHVGNSNYQPAVSGTQDVTINPGVQLIAFTAPASRALGELPFTVTAAGGASGNPVTFTSLTPTICTATGINGSLVTLLLAGTCTLRAAQAGNANYAAAMPVDRSFMVGSGTSSVSLNTSANPSAYRSAVTLTARIGGVAPTGTARFLNGTATLCESAVSNGVATCTVSDLLEGAHSLRAYYLGDANNQPGFSAELVQIVPKIGIHQGVWWGGAQENGWGLSIMEQGDTLVAGWYYFDAAGKPTWLIVPGCTWNANKTACTGALQRATSSWFGNYRADDVRLTQVGTATFTFNDAGSGRFDYTVDGTAGSKPITRMDLGGNPSTPFDFTNVWWGGQSQNGWGLSLFAAGPTLAGVWYTYDTQGQPTWMLFNGGGWQNPSRYRSGLFRASGAPMIGAAYDASRFRSEPVGELYFEFADFNTGEMTYLVDGLLQFKSISKQKF